MLHLRDLARIPLAALALLASCATGTTVTDPPLPDAQATAPPRAGDGAAAETTGPPAVFDEVLAIAGGETVTMSQIRDELDVRIAAKEAEKRKADPNAKLTETDVNGLILELVMARIREIQLADHVHMLGHDPKRINDWIELNVADRLEQARREAGSDQQFRDRLRQTGLSVEEYRKRERDRVKKHLAVHHELSKIAEGSSLLATPKDMLRYYQAHRDDFVDKPAAEVLLLRFDPVAGAAPPSERAEAAVRRLRDGAKPDEVAEAERATVEPQRIHPDSSIAAFVRDFAFAEGRKAGDVSDPIATGERVRAVVVTARSPGGVRPFLDRAVQDEIRQRIQAERFVEIQKKIQTIEERRMRIQFGKRLEALGSR